MPCKCRAKGCNRQCDCGELYCPEHLLTMDDEEMPEDKEGK